MFENSNNLKRNVYCFGLLNRTCTTSVMICLDCYAFFNCNTSASFLQACRKKPRCCDCF